MINSFITLAPGGQNSNQYLNVVYFFNASVDQTLVAALDSCFLAYVFNMCCSITYNICNFQIDAFDLIKPFKTEEH